VRKVQNVSLAIQPVEETKDHWTCVAVWLMRW